MNLTELKIGVQAEILECKECDALVKIYEMGLLPGVTVLINKMSPLGDSYLVQIDNNMLIIRKSEAENITVKILN